jgi:hypothetical protein
MGGTRAVEQAIVSCRLLRLSCFPGASAMKEH